MKYIIILKYSQLDDLDYYAFNNGLIKSVDFGFDNWVQFQEDGATILQYWFMDDKHALLCKLSLI